MSGWKIFCNFQINLDHRVARQNAGDVVGDGGHDFPASARRQIGEKGGCDLTGHVGKGISIEE